MCPEGQIRSRASARFGLTLVLGRGRSPKDGGVGDHTYRMGTVGALKNYRYPFEVCLRHLILKLPQDWYLVRGPCYTGLGERPAPGGVSVLGVYMKGLRLDLSSGLGVVQIRGT